MGMHHNGNSFECGSSIVTDPTSRTAVLHTSMLSLGMTKVLESRKKSPPLATVDGAVVTMLPFWLLIFRLSRPVAADDTE
jgi:hypothetical protein